MQEVDEETVFQKSVIRVPVIFDKKTVTQQVTRNIVLSPKEEMFRPEFRLINAEDFRIVEVFTPDGTYFNGTSEIKNLELFIIVEYSLVFTDGKNKIRQQDKAVFKLVLDRINYPQKLKCFENQYGKASEPFCKSSLNIKVEAVAEGLADIICPCTGALILEIGAFFIVNCEHLTQLSVPSYQLCNDLLTDNTPLNLLQNRTERSSLNGN